MKQMLLYVKDSRATFSPCQQYRYTLTRWFSADPNAAYINFIMLNPSTADEHQNDPTVHGCQTRAHQWGYGGLVVTNLFAWRSTDPKVLPGIADPVGPENDISILLKARAANTVVCAWGVHGSLNGRAEHVVRLLRDADIKLYVLRLTPKTQVPEHPLYIPHAEVPKPWA